MRRRLTVARVARLATVRPDGRPHIVPCCFALASSDTVFSAVDAKPKTTLALQRLANVRANPRASLLVDEYSDDWSAIWWVRIEGPARIVVDASERELALDLLAQKYEQYRRNRPAGDVLAIHAALWRSWP